MTEFTAASDIGMSAMSGPASIDNAEDVMPTILFVDDEPTAVKYFQRAIASLAPVITAGSVEDGIRLLDTHAASLAVLVSDQRMPGRFGNELLRYARENYPHMVRILTTAYSEIEYTVDAINEGQIHRYIKKPWEISTLRMELKLALEFADLRRERDQLLHEKILVRKNQTVSHRIGSLYLLCQSMYGETGFATLEAYLSGAMRVGVEAPENDWLLMDYADLVGAEAQRSSAFAQNMRNAHANGHALAANGLQLPQLLADSIKAVDDGFLIADPLCLKEYLVTSCATPVSHEHAVWLNYLASLSAAGQCARFSADSSGIRYHIVPSDAQKRPPSLADWIAQF